MAQTYIKQLIFSWLRMVHREITEIEIGNAAFPISIFYPTPHSFFTLKQGQALLANSL